ncbi:MAG: hypothetical protein KDA70_05565 [Planctomycetaceae bacterium]|nr:hypothetical protein [Planctomycetaceae bacterium]MCA9018698.1 hypothetical protein [Planctomycetaceae bacterium]
MSINYILTPVTPQLLEWSHECGVPISRETPVGRTVSRADLEKALQSLNGFTSDLSGSEDDFSAQVDSVETFEWKYESDDPVMNQAFGGTHTSPKESISIECLTDKDQNQFLSLHGDITLIVRIAKALASRSGPQAAFATCDGIPAFFLPDQETPIWKEPWV